MLHQVIIEQLETIGTDKVLSSPIDLIAYSFDGTFEQHLPDVVVLPETNEEVSAVVRIASQHDVKVEQIVGEIFQVALDLGGTLSGEHGIGTFKLPYMREALGPASINIQWRVKQALDPQNILNPGKVLPEP